ncbi:MAG: sigma-70 family RNA polymerase sigma factor [Gemmataceae bacterium]
MSSTPAQQVIARLYEAVAGEQATDAALLDAFVRERSDAAFAELARRHGAMVWGVCRRLLSSHQDAEDCFQATFLVLLRKADSVRPRFRVGAWLHGVAYNTALKARSVAAKRGHMERQVEHLPEPAPKAEPGADATQALDRALSELPEKYRTALVLCEMEGRPLKDVARELDCPIGTLAGRLSRGRALLARRLARRGVAVSAAAIATLLAEGAHAAPPALVIAPASAAAVALADATIRALFLAKLKMSFVLAATVVTLALGLGGSLYYAFARHPAAEVDQTDLAGRDADRPSPPPKAPVGVELVAGWEEGEKYVYSVRIEASLPDFVETVSSVNTYTAAPERSAWTRLRGNLIAQGNAGEGLLLQNRSASRSRSGRGPLPMFAKGERRRSWRPCWRTSRAGRPARFADGDSWQTADDCVVMVPPPGGAAAGRKGAEHVARETSHFCVSGGDAKTVTISKRYTLQTHKMVEGQPFFEFEGNGSITFDVKAGLPRRLELKGVMRGANWLPDTPITVEYRLLEGDERAKALKTP